MHEDGKQVVANELTYRNRTGKQEHSNASVSLYKIDHLFLPSHPQMKICAQPSIDVEPIEVGDFSERRNIPSSPDVSYPSAALSY